MRTRMLYYQTDRAVRVSRNCGDTPRRSIGAFTSLPMYSHAHEYIDPTLESNRTAL
jgi:hypothetical protein